MNIEELLESRGLFLSDLTRKEFYFLSGMASAYDLAQKRQGAYMQRIESMIPLEDGDDVREFTREVSIVSDIERFLEQMEEMVVQSAVAFIFDRENAEAKIEEIMNI